jgi:undecaprenyl diphosphate synthase
VALLTRLRSARAVRALGRLAEHGPPGERGVVPTSVAIIMDGNGRWAEQRGQSVSAGHRAGAKALKAVVREAGDIGIRDLTVFSFSTENWSRPKDEVDDLMGLFCELIDREIPALHDERVRVRFIGRCEDLPPDLRRRIEAAEALTAENERLRLFIAMNYGGRAEIVDAARRFAAEAPADATEVDFGRYLYGPDMGDPELLIRTSGEQRLSNFLLWQAAYAELHFSPKLWPDFGPEDLRAAIDDYAGRQRRFGARST